MTKRPWFLRVRTGNNCQSSDFGRGRCHASSSDPLHAKGLQQPKHCPQHVSDWQNLAKIDRFWQILLLSVVCWVVWQLSPFSRLGPNICDLSRPKKPGKNGLSKFVNALLALGLLWVTCWPCMLAMLAKILRGISCSGIGFREISRCKHMDGMWRVLLSCLCYTV